MTAFQRRVEWYVSHGVERELAELIVTEEMRAMGMITNE